MAPIPKCIAAALLLTSLFSCEKQSDTTLEGRPRGPYNLTLETARQPLEAGRETRLTFRLTHERQATPVHDLQSVHERIIHNFIVNLDFSSFAHIHHEDFRALTRTDLDNASFHFPYIFPTEGRYRVVSEFAHLNRSWTKHFDIQVGKSKTENPNDFELSRTQTNGDYAASLNVFPEIPTAGLETKLVLNLKRGDQPVTDLNLHLGSELHGATWRGDGRYFGHLHSHTPKIAAILDLAHERGGEARARGARIQEMLVQLMCLPSELVFNGPDIPMLYVFPASGRYHLFLQVAPAGKPSVFHFIIDVTP